MGEGDAEDLPTMDEIDVRMREFDERLFTMAAEQYRNRAIHPDEECYQLDGSTFITAETFQSILGDEETHYMAWKNGMIDETALSYWNEPAVVEYLVERSLQEGDGGECCCTNAQSIGYETDCSYPPSMMFARMRTRDRDDARHDRDGIAADDALGYALYQHPDVDTVERNGSLTFVSERRSHCSATAAYQQGVWIIRLIDETGCVSATGRFDRLDIPYSGPWRASMQRMQAAKNAFDYAIQWVDGVPLADGK